MYEATFRPSQHPTTPSAPELEAGRPCWPAPLSCPQLGPIAPHPITDRADTSAARSVPHANTKRTLGEIGCWKCRQSVWACVVTWGGQGSVATRPSAQSSKYLGLVRQLLTSQPKWQRGATACAYGMGTTQRSERVAGLGTCYGWGRLARSPPEQTETTKKDKGGRRWMGASARRWVVLLSQQHVSGDLDVWGQRDVGSWTPSNLAHQE